MALLQIKLPGKHASTTLIEGIFYRRYPHLRRLKLSNFKSLEEYADLLDLELDQAFDDIVTKRSFYCVEWKEFILIHPDAVIKALQRRFQKITKAWAES